MMPLATDDGRALLSGALIQIPDLAMRSVYLSRTRGWSPNELGSL